MNIERAIDAAKKVAKNMTLQNFELTTKELGNLANIIQSNIDQNGQWLTEDLKRFNGILKYILLAIENGDIDFGVNVIYNDLIPLLTRIMLYTENEKDELDDKIDEITQSIKEQYTDFMYPNKWRGVIPEEVKNKKYKKNEYGVLYNLDYIQHIACKKFREIKDLDILIAGCGTGEDAIVCARGYNEASFTCVDISPSSLRMAQEYAKELNVKNIKFFHDDIVTMDLGKKFDIIISTGVIHHLSDPSLGVANLKKHLKDWGVLSAMVYEEYGRFEIGLFQEAVKIILRNDVDFAKGIEITKILLNEIDQTNRIVDIAWKQDIYLGEQHIVDLLLNVNEHRYNVRTLNQMLVDGGMSIVEFPNKSTMNPDNYVKSEKAKESFRSLSYLERCQLAELINGRLTKLNFYAVKEENSLKQLSLDDNDSKNYIIHKSPFLVEMSINQLDEKIDKLSLNYLPLVEENNGDYKDIIINNDIKKLLRLCNGKNKVSYIFSKLKGIDLEKLKTIIHELVKKKMLFLHV